MISCWMCLRPGPWPRGAVATLAVVGAFVVLVCCGVFIACNARDAFGQLLAVGVTFLIGLQAFLGHLPEPFPEPGELPAQGAQGRLFDHKKFAVVEGANGG